MIDHPIRSAAAAENGIVEATLLEAVVKRTGLVLTPTETLADFDFTVGDPPYAVLFNGGVFFLDPADATTVADGVTCLVSGDGRRYKLDNGTFAWGAVLSVSTSEPATPTLGDAYLVGAAATGTHWSGHDNDIAYFSRRGWVFEAPRTGRNVYNSATAANLQFDGSAWAGFAADIDTGSIEPQALAVPLNMLPVESTDNSPPGSPSEGQNFLVGTSPSGAFSGHANAVARWHNSAWVFVAAYAGASIYHKADARSYFYVGGAWVGSTTSNLQQFTTAGAATWTKPAFGSMAFVQLWAAGGSGSRAGSGDGGAGGAGGGYRERWIPLALLGATESLTIGAGGASQTVDESNGVAGGNTSFGSWLTAYGGGGGFGATSTGGGGGGGGGEGGAGSTAASSTGGTGGVDALGTSAAAGADAMFGGGGGGTGAGGVAANGARGGHSRNGGGGGGGGSEQATAGVGGNSVFGGGGGGGAGNSTTAVAGGVSQFGGNGGAGGTTIAAAGAGVQPGGGGGGSRNFNSGKGGDGQIRVTVF